MTDETRELFDAPLGVISIFPGYDIITSGGKELFAHAYTEENANRLSRLPELYDALREAAGGKCWSCAGENTETMLDHPCPKGHDEDCYVAKWRELLQKVRDGE